MEIDIDLQCPCCAASAYAAIGQFIAHDEGLSVILAASVFHDESDDDTVCAVISWDARPSREQIADFRRVWNRMTDMAGAEFAHEAPSSVVDHPGDYSLLN